MATETALKLPVIDFSKEDLKPASPEWDSVRSQVQQALQQYGCFEAIFDELPIELRKQIFTALEELFNLPLQTKLKNVSKRPFGGYLGPGLLKTPFESIGIECVNIMKKVEDTTKVFWPQGNASFSKTIHSFSEALSGLDQTIRRMILESFGLEKYMDEHMDSTNYLLRVMKYEAPKTTEHKFGLRTHTDKNMLTILYDNQVEGLEVQTKYGEWIKVKPSPDSFVAVMGDAFYAWLNGQLHSPYHRVMMRGNEVRYSVGLFTTPKEGYIIKAPEKMIDEEHPLLFKPYDHVQFLHFYNTNEAMNRSPSPLKEYCGV